MTLANCTAGDSETLAGLVQLRLFALCKWFHMTRKLACLKRTPLLDHISAGEQPVIVLLTPEHMLAVTTMLFSAKNGGEDIIY